MVHLKFKQPTENGKCVRLERLLADISTFFINLPADRIDREIENVQCQICEFLDIDRSTLWQIADDDSETFILTHIYQPPDIPEPPTRMNAKEFFPWATQKIKAGEIVPVSRMADLPAEAARDLETFRHFEAKSTLLVPLSIGQGPVIGVMSFAALRRKIDWKENIVELLRALAQMFANALSRKHTEMQLRESKARIDLATEAAGAGLWSVKTDFGNVWVNSKTREIFEFSPDEELAYDSFFNKIHPDDVKKVDQVVRQALARGDDLMIDYRIVLSDGKVRWITSRGQRHLGPDGEPDGIIGLSADITERKQMEEQLREKLSEIEFLKRQLEKENIYLREEIELQNLHEEIVGRSPAMKRVLQEVEQVARTDATVLIQGETGTGKELLARAVHNLSDRKDRVLVTVNCASFPPTLVESELFGRERGAYTGALTQMAGRFELADRGTLFLDEIGELPLEVQAKLLRVLEEGCFERLGSSKPLRVNVRIIAATNRDLESEVEKGKFRKDLYYRLNVFPIVIPPLRERPEDIPPLVWAFVRQYSQKMGKRIEHISRKSKVAIEAFFNSRRFEMRKIEIVGAVVLFLALWSVSALAQELIVFPAKGQSPEQMERDKADCYVWAKQETGFDPMQPPPPMAQAPQPASAAPTGERLRGAARGAAVGAVVGEIANDDAGKGAAAGAAGGVMVGGMRKRDKEREQVQQQEQAQQQQQAAYDQARSTYNRAFGACIEGKGYSVK